jgi:predicted nuclease of predicted toxin-antitoxin system
MLRLYTDVQVKAAITIGLRRRGIDVVTAQEDGSQRLDDEPLLERATALGRVLFSQDDDLLAIARACQVEGVLFAGLIYGHQLAATIGKYVLDLEVVCKVLEPEDMVNRIEYLPLG